MEDHETWVEFSSASKRWIVMCSPCGIVGAPQDREADAQVIADRHTEIGGFEGSTLAPR